MLIALRYSHLRVARLFNAPLDDPQAEAIGVSTIGSSEAIILSVLAAKRAWKNKRKAQGKSTENPNIVMVSNADTPNWYFIS